MGSSSGPGNGSANVYWSAPGDSGVSAINGYRVFAFPGGHTCATTGAGVVAALLFIQGT